MFRALRSLALLLGFACRSSADAPGGFVDDAGARVRLPGPPQRIVSLIPATTELVFALGAGDRLVGRTHWCDYPAAAARVPDLGSGIDPNLEAVLAARPDLVLLYRSGANAAAAARLGKLGIPVLQLATDRIDDLLRSTRLLGRALGAQSSADSLVRGIQQDLVAATRSPVRQSSRPTVFILVWNRPPLTLGRASFLSEIVERAGARNVFDDLAAPSGPIAIESVAARDPDFILTGSADEPGLTLPEWQVVPAIRQRRFLRIQGSEFNRPSPRIASAIRQLGAALDSALR